MDINEELEIASEQDSTGTVLSAESFTKKIKEVSLPKTKCVTIDAKLEEVITLMQKNNFGSVIITENNKLKGIITERDILMKVIGLHENWKSLPVTDFMTKNPQSLQPDDEIAYVLNNMHVGGYRHIPIVNQADEPIAMMSIKDITHWVLDHFPTEILNMTGEPFRGDISREGG